MITQTCPRSSAKGIYIEGLTALAIESTSELTTLIQEAIENRMVRATNMNDESSRSHMLFTIVNH